MATLLMTVRPLDRVMMQTQSIILPLRLQVSREERLANEELKWVREQE